MSAAGVGPLGSESTVYQDVSEHFMLPSADKLQAEADFILEQESASAHTAQSATTCFNVHRITVPDWPTLI